MMMVRAGTGKIGQITAKILKGFGPKRLLGFDVFQSDAMKVRAPRTELRGKRAERLWVLRWS